MPPAKNPQYKVMLTIKCKTPMTMSNNLEETFGADVMTGYKFLVKKNKDKDAAVKTSASLMIVNGNKLSH